MMQDTSWAQEELLNQLFDKTVVMQRYSVREQKTALLLHYSSHPPVGNANPAISTLSVTFAAVPPKQI
jgi:hypothetical protein